MRTKTCFLSRDVVFKESIFPFKSWISKSVTSPSTNHSLFLIHPCVPDQSPFTSAEFSPPTTLYDIAMPPDEFLDLVLPTDNSNQADSTNLIPTRFAVPAVVPIRKSSRIHKPPTYLRGYHYNLVVAPMLASATFSP